MSQLSAIVDKLVTNASRGLFQNDSAYVSELCLSPLTVIQDSGKIGSYGQSHLRIVNDLMGGESETPRVHVDLVSSDSYQLEKHGLKSIITEEDMRNYEKPFDARQDRMKYLMSRLWLSKEYALASTLTATGTMTKNTTLSGTSQWSDYANSDPLDDIKTGRHSIRDNAGVVPNSVVMDYKVMDYLRFHPAILENLGFTRARAGQMTVNELAMALDVDNVYIAKAVYNTSDQGQDNSLSPVWGKHFVMFYAPKSPTLRDQTLGFYVKQNAGRTVYVNPQDEPPLSEKIQVIDKYDYVITDVNCGYLIYNAIA